MEWSLEAFAKSDYAGLNIESAMVGFSLAAIFALGAFGYQKMRIRKLIRDDGRTIAGYTKAKHAPEHFASDIKKHVKKLDEGSEELIDVGTALYIMDNSEKFDAAFSEDGKIVMYQTDAPDIDRLRKDKQVAPTEALAVKADGEHPDDTKEPALIGTTVLADGSIKWSQPDGYQIIKNNVVQETVIYADEEAKRKEQEAKGQGARKEDKVVKELKKTTKVLQEVVASVEKDRFEKAGQKKDEADAAAPQEEQLMVKPESVDKSRPSEEKTECAPVEEKTTELLNGFDDIVTTPAEKTEEVQAEVEIEDEFIETDDSDSKENVPGCEFKSLDKFLQSPLFVVNPKTDTPLETLKDFIRSILDAGIKVNGVQILFYDKKRKRLVIEMRYFVYVVALHIREGEGRDNFIGNICTDFIIEVNQLDKILNALNVLSFDALEKRVVYSTTPAVSQSTIYYFNMLLTNDKQYVSAKFISLMLSSELLDFVKEHDCFEKLYDNTMEQLAFGKKECEKKLTKDFKKERQEIKVPNDKELYAFISGKNA